MNDKIRFDVYYDYLCPYAHATSVWVRQLKEALGERLEVGWRAFPLEQVNATEGPDWKLWEQPAEHRSQGLLAFHAAIAAREQGVAAFERFHHALMDTRHVERRTLTRRATLTQLAERVGLDLARFERDLDDRSLLAAIGEDYAEGRERHGVFGTPTLVFPGGPAIYLKMLPAPPPEEAAAVLEDLLRVTRERPYIAEFKRTEPVAA